MKYLIVLVGLAIYFAPVLYIAKEFHREWAQEFLDEQQPAQSKLKQTLIVAGLAIWFIVPVALLLWFKTP